MAKRTKVNMHILHQIKVIEKKRLQTKNAGERKDLRKEQDHLVQNYGRYSDNRSWRKELADIEK